jgi:hypothetical protein
VFGGTSEPVASRRADCLPSKSFPHSLAANARDYSRQPNSIVLKRLNTDFAACILVELTAELTAGAQVLLDPRNMPEEREVTR